MSDEMDEQNQNEKKVTEDMVRRKLKGLAGNLLFDIGADIGGRWNVPEDILGHFADRHVHYYNFELIADYINSNWPQVAHLYAGCTFGELYISVELPTLDKTVHQAHWPIEQWVKSQFPTLSDFAFFFHGPNVKPPLHDIEIYPSIPHPQSP